jgi:hypothetical protein
VIEETAPLANHQTETRAKTAAGAAGSAFLVEEEERAPVRFAPFPLFFFYGKKRQQQQPPAVFQSLSFSLCCSYSCCCSLVIIYPPIQSNMCNA